MLLRGAVGQRRKTGQTARTQPTGAHPESNRGAGGLAPREEQGTRQRTIGRPSTSSPTRARGSRQRKPAIGDSHARAPRQVQQQQQQVEHRGLSWVRHTRPPRSLCCKCPVVASSRDRRTRPASARGAWMASSPLQSKGDCSNRRAAEAALPTGASRSDAPLKPDIRSCTSAAAPQDLSALSAAGTPQLQLNRSTKQLDLRRPLSSRARPRPCPCPPLASRRGRIRRRSPPRCRRPTLVSARSSPAQ